MGEGEGRVGREAVVGKGASACDWVGGRVDARARSEGGVSGEHSGSVGEEMGGEGTDGEGGGGEER